MKRNIVSLKRFSDFHDEVKGVEVRSFFDFPEYVPTTEAQVDIGRIATVCRIGRLESVNFKLTDGESDSNSTTVVGINPDGSAVAGSIRSRSVARASSDGFAETDEHMNFPKGASRIKINANHPAMNDRPLRDIEPWSELVDKGLRQGLSKSVRKQLVKEHRSDRVAELAIAGIVIVPGVFLFNIPIESAVGGSLFVTTRMFPRGKTKNPERKLIPGFAFDRYAVAQGLLATRKIVTPQ